MTTARPAILGGAPAFPEGLPLTRVLLDEVPGLAARLAGILATGMLTNGRTVRELEDQVADLLGVAHVVGVANCTAGLMLVYQALGVAGGRVVLPSFTFAASAHAVWWAGGEVDFAEVDEASLTLDPADIDGRLDGAAAVSATHVYGTPCPVDAVERIAGAASVPVVYDAAHALGSLRRGVPVGRYGTASVFSLSPTKVVVAGEGGLVATDDAGLAQALRLGRDYGNPGDYDCRFPGLNARLSELHAAVALSSLAGLAERVEHRNCLAATFAAAIAGVPGLRLAAVDPEDRSTYKDLTVVVDADCYGLTAAVLGVALAADGIESRHYYHPPIHRQAAYAGRWRLPRDLPVTDRMAASVISPPLWSHMDHATVGAVADVFVRLHEHGDDVRRAVGPAPGDQSRAAPAGTIGAR